MEVFEGPLSPDEYAATQSRYWPARISQTEREAFMIRLRAKQCSQCGAKGMHICDAKLVEGAFW